MIGFELLNFHKKFLGLRLSTRRLFLWNQWADHVKATLAAFAFAARWRSAEKITFAFLSACLVASSFKLSMDRWCINCAVRIDENLSPDFRL